MGVASQQWLDATKSGNYSTPAEWETLAVSWQASGVPILDAVRWIEAGINSSAMAVTAIQAGLTPADAARIGPWIAARGLPSLAHALGAAAIFRGIAAVGTRFPPEDRVLLLTTFFSEMGNLNVDVGEV